jgi:hypothetical protein
MAEYSRRMLEDGLLLRICPSCLDWREAKAERNGRPADGGRGKDAGAGEYKGVHIGVA